MSSVCVSDVTRFGLLTCGIFKVCVCVCAMAWDFCEAALLLLMLVLLLLKTLCKMFVFAKMLLTLLLAEFLYKPESRFLEDVVAVAVAVVNVLMQLVNVAVLLEVAVLLLFVTLAKLSFLNGKVHS